MVMETILNVPVTYMTQLTDYVGTTTSDTQPQKNIATMGNVGTSDFMMILWWNKIISSRSP